MTRPAETRELREEMARASDPLGWSWFDRAPDDHPAKPVFRTRALAQADAALAAIEASGTHVVVPLEPTDDMVNAEFDEPAHRLPITADEVIDMYRAILAARPRDVAPTEQSDG